MPIFPHERVASIAFSSPARHDGAHQYCDEHSSENQEKTDLGDGWKRAVHVHDNEGGQPREYEVYDKDLPPLVCVSFMEETVHGNDLVGED